MDAGEDGGTIWLPIAEAAPALALTVDGLRSRIRRGLVATRKGNDGRLLVPVSVNARATVHGPVMDAVGDRSEAEELRAEVVELRVALARAEERLTAGERRERDSASAATDLRGERDRLAAELAEARKPWAVRLVEAFRRR